MYRETVCASARNDSALEGASVRRRSIVATRRALALLSVAALLGLGLSTNPPVPPTPAHADTVTVPYVDRLGCGTSDDAVTPIFSWNGGGTAVNGGGYATTTAASAFPPAQGTFSNTSGAPAYTVYAPLGYGSAYQFRATNGLGFPSVQAGRTTRLTMTLPHAQAIQFTLGGMQSPTRMLISGNGPGGPVIAHGAARSGGAGDATAVQVGNAVRVTGATPGTSDPYPRNAADVWFSEPVSELTLELQPIATGSDAGFLVTAPIACQSGALATEGTVSAPTVDTAAGAVSHNLSFTTTVRNTSPASGAVLYPSVTAPLAAALSAQGITLDSVDRTSASAPACEPAPGFDGSGPLLTPGSAFLAPGESCTLEWTARVTMPQSSAQRVADLGSVLSSSAVAAGRQKSTTSTALVFPGLSSALAISESGPSRGQAGQQLARTATLTNSGQGAALGTRLALRFPANVAVSGFPSSCAFSAPELNCEVANLAPGGSRSIAYSVTLPAGAAPGTVLPVEATATADSQSATATATAELRVLAPPPVQTPKPPSALRPHPTTGAPAPQRPTAPRPPAATAEPRPTATPPKRAVAKPPAPASPPAAPQDLPPAPHLSFGAATIEPGTVSALRGLMGPNASSRVEQISLQGRVNQGVVYRTVRVSGISDPGDCSVQTREFSCSFTLKPGETAALEIRLFADALNAPQNVIQQLSIADSSGGTNAQTVTASVAAPGSSDTDDWIDALVLDMSSMPAAFVPLLAMMLLALAATTAERRQNRQ